MFLTMKIFMIKNMFVTQPVRKRLCGEKLKVNIIMRMLNVISIEEDDDPYGNETIQGMNH